jgi:hypothetical protein
MSRLPLTKKRWVIPVGIVLVGILTITFTVLLVLKLIGHSLGIRSLASSVKNITLAVLDRRSVASYRQGKYTNIIFLHHSVGHNLIEQGVVREAFTKVGYSFFDHDYNWPGLTDPSGKEKGYNYNVPGDNTDIDGLARIFSQHVYPLPINTLSGLLQHEVIIFKSCFPNNDITGDEQLAQNKAMYLGLRTVMDKHPDKIFIVVTTPPLNPAETNSETAARARVMADWLQSDEFLLGHPNVFTFDFYSYLADDQPGSPEFNMLRKEYQDGTDSHPNRLANETIGSEFVQFVIQSIDSYQTK